MVTPAGRVYGGLLEVAGSRQVRQFLGIPYAEPPTGQLRFKVQVRNIKKYKLLPGAASGAGLAGAAGLPGGAAALLELHRRQQLGRRGGGRLVRGLPHSLRLDTKQGTVGQQTVKKQKQFS